MLNVHFEPVQDGFLLSVQDAKNLNINLVRLETYIKSLEVIIDSYSEDLRGYSGD